MYVLPGSAFTFRYFTVEDIQAWEWLTLKYGWTAAISKLKSCQTFHHGNSWLKNKGADAEQIKKEMN